MWWIYYFSAGTAIWLAVQSRGSQVCREDRGLIPWVFNACFWPLRVVWGLCYVIGRNR